MITFGTKPGPGRQNSNVRGAAASGAWRHTDTGCWSGMGGFHIFTTEQEHNVSNMIRLSHNGPNLEKERNVEHWIVTEPASSNRMTHVRGFFCLFLTLMQGCVWACVSGGGSVVRCEASSAPLGCGREQRLAGIRVRGWRFCTRIICACSKHGCSRTLQEPGGPGGLGGPGPRERWRRANPRYQLVDANAPRVAASSRYTRLVTTSGGMFSFVRGVSGLEANCAKRCAYYVEKLPTQN